MRRSVLLVACAAVVVAVVGGAAVVAFLASGGSGDTTAASRQERWVMRDLGTLGGRYSEALALNDRGDVVGYSEVEGGGYHVFLWRSGKMRDLGPVLMDPIVALTGEVYATLPDDRVTVNERGEVLWAGPDGLARLWANGSVRRLPFRPGAYVLNDRGQVIGSVATRRKDDFGNVISRAAMWENGKLTLLGSPAGNSSATLINNNGQIVIESFAVDGVRTGTFLWQSGLMRRIPSSASGMNDRGRVIMGNTPSDGLMWQNGRVRHLGSIAPESINNAGQIVGRSPRAVRALLWERGKLISLAPLGEAYSWVEAINDRGQILVGYGTTRQGQKHMVIWRHGIASYIGDSPPAAASALNNSGQIVGCTMTSPSTRLQCGIGDVDFTASFHAVLWTPRSG